jgi:hypothetical protein
MCPGRNAKCGTATLVNKFDKTWVGMGANMSEID